jgi:hypothetical protein
MVGVEPAQMSSQSSRLVTEHPLSRPPSETRRHCCTHPCSQAFPSTRLPAAMSALRALASSPASGLRPHRPASYWAPAALTARPTWPSSITSGSSLATISHTAGAQHVLRRPAIIPAASAGGSDAQQYTTRDGVTVTVRSAGLQYDLPHYKEHYGPQLEPVGLLPSMSYMLRVDCSVSAGGSLCLCASVHKGSK